MALVANYSYPLYGLTYSVNLSNNAYYYPEFENNNNEATAIEEAAMKCIDDPDPFCENAVGQAYDIMLKVDPSKAIKIWEACESAQQTSKRNILSNLLHSDGLSSLNALDQKKIELCDTLFFDKILKHYKSIKEIALNCIGHHYEACQNAIKQGFDKQINAGEASDIAVACINKPDVACQNLIPQAIDKLLNQPIKRISGLMNFLDGCKDNKSEMCQEIIEQGQSTLKNLGEKDINSAEEILSACVATQYPSCPPLVENALKKLFSLPLSSSFFDRIQRCAFSQDDICREVTNQSLNNLRVFTTEELYDFGTSYLYNKKASLQETRKVFNLLAEKSLDLTWNYAGECIGWHTEICQEVVKLASEKFGLLFDLKNKFHNLKDKYLKF